MALLKQSTAYNRTFLMVDSADHITGKTGLTPTVTLSKNAGAFAAAGGTVTEISSGWYKIALTTTDTNTVGDLAYHCTAAGADPTDFADQVTTYSEFVTAGNINTIIAGVWDYLTGSIATVNSIGKYVIDYLAGIKTKTDTLPNAIPKNTAYNNFMFFMVLSSDHLTPATGKSISASRSLDGGAFAACANPVTEVSNGWYKINLDASDLNGDTVAFIFEASGCDNRQMLVKCF